MVTTPSPTPASPPTPALASRRRVLCASAVLAQSAVLALWAAARPVRAAPRLPDLAAAEERVLRQANAFRAREGLPPLAPQPALAEAARAFARHMAEHDRFGHEADGRGPVQRVEAAGYAWCMVAENIAFRASSRGFSTEALADGFVEGWIASPGHRHNLVSPQATETGVGIAQAPGRPRWLAVQLFGRPRAARGGCPRPPGG